FDVKTPSGNQRVTLSRTVQTEFDTWDRSGASAAFGSSFTLEQLFTVQGDTSSITAVTVTLTNVQGRRSSPATTFNSQRSSSGGPAGLRAVSPKVLYRYGVFPGNFVFGDTERSRQPLTLRRTRSVVSAYDCCHQFRI